MGGNSQPRKRDGSGSSTLLVYPTSPPTHRRLKSAPVNSEQGLPLFVAVKMRYLGWYEFAENHMPKQHFDRSLLEAAIVGFESQKKQIDTRIAELCQMLSGGPTQTAATPQAPSRKRKVSAAARRRMAIAQRKRWAKIRGESELSALATPEPPKAKRRISEEGMKRIIAATKKRWRLAKAAKAQPATAKKAAPARKKVAVKKAATKKAAVKARPAKAARKASAKRPQKAPAPAPTMAEAAG